MAPTATVADLYRYPIVTGSAPWAEDRWRLLRIGDVVFRNAKGCDRCVMPAIDPEGCATAGNETAGTLMHR
jgi:uncharacterized protein